MAYTVSKIRNSKPDVLATAASDAEQSAQRIDAQISKGRQQMVALREDWVGTASDAADKQYGELIGYQQTYSRQFRVVKGILAKRGPKLVEYRSQLDTAINDAEDIWDVADDGSVSPGWMMAWYLMRNPTQLFKIESMRIEIENNIRLLMAQFEAEDVATGYEIRQAGRELT